MDDRNYSGDAETATETHREQIAPFVSIGELARQVVETLREKIEAAANLEAIDL